MNVKLLRKVKRHILEEPKRFVMSVVVMSVVDTYKENSLSGKVFGMRPFPKCGTAACVAGWACILSGKDRLDVGMITAQRLLDLTPEQAMRLFEPSKWPEQYEAGTTDDGKNKTAKIAAARIDHFIKTKGAE